MNLNRKKNFSDATFDVSNFRGDRCLNQWKRISVLFKAKAQSSNPGKFFHYCISLFQSSIHFLFSLKNLHGSKEEFADWENAIWLFSSQKSFAIWIFFRVQNFFERTIRILIIKVVTLPRPLNLKINFVNHISRILKRKTL